MVPMDLDEPPQKAGLFAQSSFAIIHRDAIDEDIANKLLQKIELHEGDAVIHKQNSDSLMLEGITHIVSTTFDFPEYDSACDAFIPVVKPAWIDASLAKDKLANPRQFSPDLRLFMSDVVVCCADLPDGDAEAITGGVIAMGGLFSNKVASQVTHLVALTMESEKCRIVASRKLNIKIVLPHWFDDCLKLGRRIDEQPYLLPNPEILRHSNENPPRGADPIHLSGAIDPDPPNHPSSVNQIPSLRPKLDVFKKKNVMLSKDLGIGSHLRQILEKLIIGGGGKTVPSVRKADMYICKYREGEDYASASRSGKEVGNLAWLYFLITNNVWTSPMRRLLHYPVARQGLPEFKCFRISLSNYSGEARVYLENLINAAGAESTKTLKQDNTHLITAHTQSEKCSAAKDWGIHVVNHLWLEESYAKWKIQSVTDTRYTHFPKRTNLGEVVGQTKIDRAALEQHFFSDSDVHMLDGPSLPRPMQPKDQNIVGGPVPASSAVNSPAAPVGPARKAPVKTVKDTRNMGDEEKFRTPAPSRFVAAGKENETPGTTGSRKSKEMAAARLHELTPDIALFQKETKRKGGVIYGGRRKNDEDRLIHARKRSIEEASDTEEVDENDTKRAKRANPPPSVRLMISGYKKWVGHPRIENSDKKQLESLGIKVVFDPARASHLAAPKILRTAKFVLAIAYAPTIISTQFIDDCLDQDTCLDPDDYLLEDQANEKKFGFSLKLATERARENRNKLLSGKIVYCMESIYGGFDTFREIVEVNGGQCIQYRGRKGTMVPSRRAETETSTTDDAAQKDVYLISNPEEDKLWNHFRQMAEGSRKIPKIVKTDWLLETAMCQKLLPTNHHEV